VVLHFAVYSMPLMSAGHRNWFSMSVFGLHWGVSSLWTENPGGRRATAIDTMGVLQNEY